MKNNGKIKIWAVLLFLSAMALEAHATVTAYYRGEASPGRLVDSINGYNLTQVGNPGNPTSPLPPEGFKWLYGGVSSQTGNYYTFPTAAIPTAGPTFIMWAYFEGTSSLVANNYYPILTVQLDGGTAPIIMGAFYFNGTMYAFGANGSLNTFVQLQVSLNVRHLMTAYFAGDGTGSFDIDGNTQPFSGAPTGTNNMAGVLGEELGTSFQGWTVDAIAFGTSAGDTYPGPYPPQTATFTSTQTRTPTPTPTNTPFRQHSPGGTRTPGGQLSRSITPTPTPFRTYTAFATRTPGGQLVRSFTNTPRATPIVWTKTQTPTSTNSPSPTQTATISPTPNLTLTRTNTATITKTSTISPTPTRTPTVTRTNTPSPTASPTCVTIGGFCI